MIRSRIRLAISLVGSLAATRAGAAGMKLERERLINLEGPETVGLLKRRFDFQHNFKDYTLLPIAELTLTFGVWRNVQIEGKALLHNSDTSVFGSKNVFQFNVMEYGAKWAILDQSQDDWFSLATGGSLGRSDIKFELDPPVGTGLVPSRLRYHLNNRSAYSVIHYDTMWFAQSFTVHWASFVDSRTAPNLPKVNSVISTGFGERLKLLERRDTRIHLIADFQPRSFVSKYSANAWGVGTQLMVKSPHVFTFFLSNTHGDTGSESMFGTRSFEPGPNFRRQEKFYNFRWSYRF